MLSSTIAPEMSRTSIKPSGAQLILFILYGLLCDIMLSAYRLPAVLLAIAPCCFVLLVCVYYQGKTVVLFYCSERMMYCA